MTAARQWLRPQCGRILRPSAEHLQRLGALLQFVELLEGGGLLFQEFGILVTDDLQLIERRAGLGCDGRGRGLRADFMQGPGRDPSHEGDEKKGVFHFLGAMGPPRETKIRASRMFSSMAASFSSMAC